jgi:hypothetical protein
MNFSIALMYLCIVAGIEAVDRLVPKRIENMRASLANWSAQPLADDIDGHRIFLIAILALFAFMLYVSITEHPIATIWEFLSIEGDDESNVARNAFRLHFATSPSYGGTCAVALVIYAITRPIMTLPKGLAGFEFVYFRVFEVESQALLENFATFPFVHPHRWSANIRPIASLMGLHYIPSYSIVAHTRQGTYDVTSPSLFIADAWADFSYAGVIVFSLMAGAVCRSIDAVFLARGKTVVAVAVLGATFMGVFTLLVTALNTALLSGGLLLAPILAGLLVMATRYLGRQRRTSPLERAVYDDRESNQVTMHEMLFQSHRSHCYHAGT